MALGNLSSHRGCATDATIRARCVRSFSLTCLLYCLHGPFGAVMCFCALREGEATATLPRLLTISHIATSEDGTM